MKKSCLVLAGGFVLLCAALPALASPIVVGTSGGGASCLPFGCAFNGEYQQVYTASDFSGPVTITGLEFFNTSYNSNATSMNSGTWTIDLSTTSADWNTLSAPMANNIGTDRTQVFTGNLSQSWAFRHTLTIAFSTPFTYDPGNGNLLMDVQSSSVVNGNEPIWFDFDGSAGLFGYYFSGYNDHGGGSYFSSGGYPEGLVTGFFTQSASVPEPGSLGLLGFGLGLLALGGVAASAKRRRASLA